ncbi:MAG: hypothetical protein ACRC6O_13260 [Flavobacterium sp.]
MISEFLQDSDGHLSSKRLGFLATLLSAIIATITTLAILLCKEKYILAIDLIDSMWLSCFGFAGVVASEFFRRKKNA